MIEKTAKDIPCHVCRKNTATTERYGFPVCADCAIKHEEKLKAEARFEW